MDIRTAENKDLPEILTIYDKAREFMKSAGNPTQWANGYPQKELIENDIKNNNCYVIHDNGKIIGTFAFIIGNDPTYKVIENGSWSSENKYGTIHRLASDGRKRGITKCCFDFCINIIDYLRVDTHNDNKPMQAAIERYGFKKCGTIYVRDGSPRIAYDYIRRIKN